MAPCLCDDVDGGEIQRSYSNPAMNNYFDNQDRGRNVHFTHDRETASTLAHITHLDRQLGHVSRQAISIEELDDEVCKVARRLEMMASQHKLAEANRPLSKRSARSEKSSATGQAADDEEPFYRSCVAPVMLAIAAVVAVVTCIVWHGSGTLHHDLGVAHVHTLRTRMGFIKSPMYTAGTWPGSLIELHGQGSEMFDIRMLLMSSTAQKLRAQKIVDNVTENTTVWSPGNGTLHYNLLADGEVFHYQNYTIPNTVEQEIFETVDVAAKVGQNHAQRRFHVHVWADTADDEPLTFLCQVVQMGALARHRIWIGTTIFVVTMVFIMTEVIHRSYSAFLGTIAMHFVVTGIQDTPRLTELAATVDFGSLMLLFFWEMMMHMLSLTGFFEWFTVEVVAKSCRSPTLLFFLLSNAAGVLSAFLDNTTVTLLMGPLAFSLAEKTGLRSMPLYFAITIASSIGGAATMIGDPPNIVIHSKMGVGFVDFLAFNGPLVLLILLPLSTLVLYWQFRGTLVDRSMLDEDGFFRLDLAQLRSENQITDVDCFRGICAILAGVMLAFLTSPLHGVDPAWVCLFGMIAAAIVYHKHHVEDLLLAVEWDTLLFFAILFVLVETLVEIGLIRQLGDWLTEALLYIDEGPRMIFALALVLWVCAIGSTFMESLPFTAAIISILQDLQTRNLPGMNIHALTWAVSIGACIGGIGSSLGAFTNVTAVAISEKYGESQHDKVLNFHFLRYGFPLLVLLMLVAMLYHWLIFEHLGLKGTL